MGFFLDLVTLPIEYILKDNHTSSKRYKAINRKHLHLKGLVTLWWNDNEILGHQ